jgi:hypothetical protein
VFQLCFNFNKIHDSVGKALRTANQDHVTANSHPRQFHPRFMVEHFQKSNHAHAIVTPTPNRFMVVIFAV